jgi:hypothetical protein
MEIYERNIMARHVIKYTSESWRTVEVDGDTPEEALRNFQNEENVYWETDSEFDVFVDYEHAEVE